MECVYAGMRMWEHALWLVHTTSSLAPDFMPTSLKDFSPELSEAWSRVPPAKIFSENAFPRRELSWKMHPKNTSKNRRIKKSHPKQTNDTYFLIFARRSKVPSRTDDGKWHDALTIQGVAACQLQNLTLKKGKRRLHRKSKVLQASTLEFDAAQYKPFWDLNLLLQIRQGRTIMCPPMRCSQLLCRWKRFQTNLLCINHVLLASQTELRTCPSGMLKSMACIVPAIWLSLVTEEEESWNQPPSIFPRLSHFKGVALLSQTNSTRRGMCS